MKTLILDTSHSLLVVGIAVDNEVVYSSLEELAKKQSEYLVSRIDLALSQTGFKKSDIDEIVLTDGPGSYTGLRIAMTFVKVLTLVQPAEVYTVNTLASIAGNAEVFSFIDARSKRVFGGFARNGEIYDERIYSVDEVREIASKAVLVGDLAVLDQESNYGSVVSNIISVRDTWRKVENPDLLVPRYGQ